MVDGCSECYDKEDVLYLVGSEYYCEDCKDGIEEESVYLRDDDRRFVELIGDRDQLVLKSHGHGVVTSLEKREGRVYRYIREGDSLVSQGFIDEFDWKNGVCYGLDNALLYVVEDEEE